MDMDPEVQKEFQLLMQRLEIICMDDDEVQRLIEEEIEQNPMSAEESEALKKRVFARLKDKVFRTGNISALRELEEADL